MTDRMLGGRCLPLNLKGNETVEDIMRLGGLRRESACEIWAFAQRLKRKAIVADSSTAAKCVHCGRKELPLTYRSTGHVSFPGGFPLYEVECSCDACHAAATQETR